MNKTISKNRFKTLGKALSKMGIGIDYQINWADSVGREIQYTDQPRLGSGTYNGIDGWYFTRNCNDNFTPKQKKLIKEILLKKGFKCKSISDYEVEFGGDRSYRPTISFINNK